MPHNGILTTQGQRRVAFFGIIVVIWGVQRSRTRLEALPQNNDYPMPWQGPNSGASHEIAKLCQIVCQLHELIREYVWKIRRLSILNFVSEVVISRVRFRFVDSLDMAPRDLYPGCQGMGYRPWAQPSTVTDQADQSLQFRYF